MATPVPDNQTITLVDTTGGAKTVTLPAVSTCLGRVITIADSYFSAGTNNISVEVSGADTIFNLTNSNLVLSNNGASVSLLAGPSNNWVVLNYWNGTL